MITPRSVDFHLDIMCPFAFHTSLWMREVRDRLDLEVNWRFFSLEEINRADGKKHPWERDWSYGWSLLRIGALLRRSSMEELDAWYLAAGTALHVEGQKPHDPDVAREILRRLDLDPGIVDAALADESTNGEIKAEHDKVVQAGGFGVPTLFFRLEDDTEQAIFGPVVVPAPTGEEALRLWDVVTGWLEFPHLYELQRPKARSDHEHIAEAFRPYLAGRDWLSINRGEVIGFDARSTVDSRTSS